jgi:heptosyltransferase-3
LSFLAGGAPVVFAPFTARRAKQWPFACWLELGRRLAAGGDRLLVAGGTADRTQAERLAAALGPPAQAVAGRLSIGPFGALLERARVLVSPDSFAMHLAAALGTPQVALFGPTDPARTGPWEGRAVVLREQPLAALGVDQVQQAVRRVLELPG